MLTVSTAPVQVPLQMKPWRPVQYAPPRYQIGQEAPGTTTTTAQPVSPPPRPQKVSDPVLFLLGAAGGAAAGYLLTIAAPKVSKSFPKPTTGIKTAGIVGGALGALVGLGVAYALKA